MSVSHLWWSKLFCITITQSPNANTSSFTASYSYLIKQTDDRSIVWLSKLEWAVSMEMEGKLLFSKCKKRKEREGSLLIHTICPKGHFKSVLMKHIASFHPAALISCVQPQWWPLISAKRCFKSFNHSFIFSNWAIVLKVALNPEYNLRPLGKTQNYTEVYSTEQWRNLVVCIRTLHYYGH